MMYKATLPVLLLLLVAGQMSAEFCMARCESMRMTQPACTMHGMAHGDCASCSHASAMSAGGAFSVPETCSGHTCNSVLGLLQNRPDQRIRPLVVAAFDVAVRPALEDGRPAHFSATRTTEFSPPFAP